MGMGRKHVEVYLTSSFANTYFNTSNSIARRTLRYDSLGFYIVVAAAPPPFSPSGTSKRIISLLLRAVNWRTVELYFPCLGYFLDVSY